MKNFRPVSNLSYLSKLIEKVIAIRLVEHMRQNAIMDKFQSAYKAHHSTETALLRVYNDVMFNIDRGNGTLLVLLDLSAAFDTIDHQILFHILEHSLCITDCVVVYPLPWPLLVGGVRCSRLWSTSQLLRPSGQQCSHSGGVCPQIQVRQCGAYVGAVEEMMCVVCVDVTEGA